MSNKQELFKLFKTYGHDKVIFIGIDISKLFHVFAISNGYGEILYDLTTVDIYDQGYHTLKNAIDSTVRHCKAEVIVFGCEPSGHYYLNLMNKLRNDYDHAIFRLVNPISTKENRKQMMQRSKTDEIDTLSIIDLLIRGESYELPRMNEIFKSIREHVRFLDRLTKQSTMLKNQIHSYLDEIYPGLENKLSNFVDTNYGIKFLEILPNPNKLKNMSAYHIVNMFGKHGYKLNLAYAQKIEKAAKSMLITNSLTIDTQISLLSIIVSQYKTTIRSINKIDAELEKLLKKLPFTNNLLQIKGIGIKGLSRVIAYCKDIYKFDSGCKLSSFAGLIPTKNQSGQAKERETISRVGHRKLRSTLIQMTQIVISNVGYFTAITIG